MIAVGTQPARPDTVEFDDRTIIDSDGLLRLERRVPRTMTVVGAGVIGVEYASMFGALGTKVTVVDQRDRTLDFLDGEIGEAFQYLLRRSNVTFRLREKVDAIESVNGRARRAARLGQGDHRPRRCSTRSAARARRTSSGSSAPASRPTSAGGSTSTATSARRVPHIFAVGDVAGGGLAATAMEQGRIAALHAFDQPVTTLPELVPTGVYAIPEIGMVGATEEQLTDASQPYVTGIARWTELARGLMTGDEDGMLKLLVDPDDRRVLGVHVHRHGRDRARPHRPGGDGPGRRAAWTSSSPRSSTTRRSRSPTRSPRSTPPTASAACIARRAARPGRLPLSRRRQPRVELEDDAADLDVVAGLEPARLERGDHAHPAQAVLDVRERLVVLEVVAGDQPVDRVAGDAELARRRRARPSNARPRGRAEDAVLGDLVLARRPPRSAGSAAGTRRSSSRASSSRPCARRARGDEHRHVRPPSRARHAAAAASAASGVDEVGLGEREHARQRGQPRVVLGQLALDHRVVLHRVRAVERREVEHVDEQPRALDVGEEVVAEPGAAAGALDQARGCRRARAGGRRPRACRAPARAS